MPKLEPGRIIFVETLDHQGRNPKKRPFVVISDNDAIGAGDILVCAAITRQIPTKPDPDYIEIPYSNSGGGETGLRARCAVHCGWLEKIDQEQITERDLGGMVSPAHFDRIMERLRKRPK